MHASRIPLFLCLLALSLAGRPGHCGNREMVETAVDGVHELNERAVGQVKNLPAEGTLRLKAQVTTEEGAQKVEVLEQEVTPLHPGEAAPGIPQNRAGALPRDCTENDISYLGGNVIAPGEKRNIDGH